MSLFFPRQRSDLSSLFRLADEFDRAANTTRTGSDSFTHNFRSFSPRFDIKETKEAYELHGELPGIEREQIDIQWSDDNTLTISGQTEHRSEYTSGSELAEATESSKKSESSSGYHKPSVDTEGEASASDIESTQVTRVNPGKEVTLSEGAAPKYLITERSFGSFHRAFQFPSRVSHEEVTANLKNGILSMKVPKAHAKEPRRIQIS